MPDDKLDTAAAVGFCARAVVRSCHVDPVRASRIS